MAGLTIECVKPIAPEPYRPPSPGDGLWLLGGALCWAVGSANGTSARKEGTGQMLGREALRTPCGHLAELSHLRV